MDELGDKLKRDFKGKKVLIVGLGLQGGGVGLVKFFSALGAIVTITDLKSEKQLTNSLSQIKNLPITLRLGRHEMADFLSTDHIFIGPSIPWDSKYIKEALEKRIPVDMEVSFFASLSPATIIGITGTRGKSTTTMMVFELLEQNKRKAYLGGNFPGVSTLDLLKKAKRGDFVVLELSSWALSGFHRKKTSPHIAVFTNLYTDHLNYYKTVADYLYDKKAIYLYQKNGDFLVTNRRLKNEIKKDHPKSTLIYFQKEDFSAKFLYLRGEHNLENAAAALAVSKILKLDQKKSLETLAQFKGVPYRLDITGEKNGVIFVNDTTSTTPVAATYAISALSDRPIVLILGGDKKNLPYGELLKDLQKVEKIVFLKGSFTDEVYSKMSQLYPSKVSEKHSDLKEAVTVGYQQAKKIGSSYLLFSPGATSFSMFENEFQRGDEFNKIVKGILKD